MNMKIIVDKLPNAEYECLFRYTERGYDMCKIRDDCCHTAKNCPYLKEQEKKTNETKTPTLRVYTVEEVMHKFIDLKYRIKDIEKIVDSDLSAYWWKEGINDAIKEIQKEIDLLKTVAQKLEQKTESKDGNKEIKNINGYTGSSQQTIDKAIDVMERYKKIEQVIDDWEHDGGAMEMSESYWLKKIKGILET